MAQGQNVAKTNSTSAIIAGSFVSNFLVATALGIQGVLYSYFLRDFQRPNSATALVGSLQMSSGAFIAIFLAPTLKRFGCRSVTIVGTVIASIGCCQSCLASELWHVQVSLGLINGIGCGFLFFAAMVNVQSQCEGRTRVTATAVVTSSSSIAPFVSAPAVNSLSIVYGWRGTLGLLGAFYMHGIVAALLMPRIQTSSPSVKDERTTDSGISTERNSDDELISFSSTDTPKKHHKFAEPIPNENNADKIDRIITRKTTLVCNRCNCTANCCKCCNVTNDSAIVVRSTTVEREPNCPALLISDDNTIGVTNNGDGKVQSRLDVPQKTICNENISIQDENEIEIRQQLTATLSFIYEQSYAKKDKQLVEKLPSERVFTTQQESYREGNMCLVVPFENNNWLVSNGNLADLSRVNLTAHETVFCKTKQNTLPENIFQRNDCVLQTDSLQKIPTTTSAVKISVRLTAHLENFFHFSLFRNISFNIFVICNVLANFGYVMPFLLLPQLASELGHPQTRSVLLISAISAPLTVARFLSAFAGDKTILRHYRAVHYAVPLILSGIVVVSAAFVSSFKSLLVAAVLFGFFSGLYIVMQQPLLVDLLGVDMFPKSFAIYTLVSGISVLSASPFAGWLVDQTGSYRSPFAVCGCLQIFGGFLATLLQLHCLRSQKKCQSF